MAGGSDNHTGGFNSSVSGGESNVASAYASSIGRGRSEHRERRVLDGSWRIVQCCPRRLQLRRGGYRNQANGDYSFAAGRRAKANAIGVFALADSTDADWIATTPNSFVGRFTGGYGLWTNAANTVGCSSPPAAAAGTA